MSVLNTIKTSSGFYYSILQRRFPILLRRKSIKQIYNYLPISDKLCTSGQPSELQLTLIAKSGFKRIINLAPHNVENALPDEAAVVAELGIPYTHIPVDFQNPTKVDFEQFCAALEAGVEQKVWVHCAANMRVSAFIYCYRRFVLNEQGAQPQTDLGKIWKPFGVWRKFIENMAEYTH